MKELKKLFETLIAGKEPYKVFDEILDSTIAIMTKKCDPGFTLRNIMNSDDEIGKKTYIEFLKQLGEAMEGFEDPMGELFMEYISKGHNGQYFTPIEICKLMDQLTCQEDRANTTLNDPTCGSGRMFLAAAARNRDIHFVGSDIDLTCCKMAALNLLLNNLSGEIYWGDVLKYEFQYVFVVGKSMLNFPIIHILKCEASWQKNKETNMPIRGEQLTLF